MAEKRIRLIIDTEDVIRRAINLRRVMAGGDDGVSDIVNAILRAALAPEIEELQRRGVPTAPASPEQSKPKRGRGRPPKAKPAGE